MPQKYVLTENTTHLGKAGWDLDEDHNVSAGTIVYKQVKYDYGLANDDTRATGERYITVTFNSDGDYPGFTVPERILKKIE